MRPVLIDLLIIGMLVLVLVAAWNYWPWQQKSLDAGLKFGERHPTLSSLLVSLGIAAVGLVAAWRTIDLLTNHASAGVFVAAAVGAAFGIAGFAVWAYSAAHRYLVAGWIGRVLFGLTLLFAAGAFGAIMGGYLPDVADAFCVSIVATRMLPWAAGVLWQAHDDARHPELRNVKVLRSMILSTGHRPPALTKDREQSSAERANESRV